MNAQFTRQAEDVFAAAKDARIPENIQAIAEDSVAKTREAYSKFNTFAKDGVKVIEDMTVAAHVSARSIGEKVLRNTELNTQAAFDAAQALARSKSIPEALRLQTVFVQQQFAIAGAQTKELFELSTKLAKQAFESVNSAAAKAFDQVKTAR
jgi:phasin